MRKRKCSRCGGSKLDQADLVTSKGLGVISKKAKKRGFFSKFNHFVDANVVEVCLDCGMTVIIVNPKKYKKTLGMKSSSS